MSSSSSSSKYSDFNFSHSPTGSLSSGDSSESNSSLNFTPFYYLTTSNNILFDPPLHKDDEVFMGPSEEELIHCHFIKTCLMKACPLMLKAHFL